jgi:hypothetical protein
MVAGFAVHGSGRAESVQDNAEWTNFLGAA